MYFKDLLPRLVKEGDDGNCGSAAVCDTLCLQVLIKLPMSPEIFLGSFSTKFEEIDV